jgi:hypothetical protein
MIITNRVFDDLFCDVLAASETHSLAAVQGVISVWQTALGVPGAIAFAQSPEGDWTLYVNVPIRSADGFVWYGGAEIAFTNLVLE